ncbi:MAG: ABC transporter substrate-binding protein [Wenzhouxiangella sp.]|nr:ABC transporter substrate-binding protein [Wenzhouxiangella sp.]MCH8477473.1 ABC transporter substrate-binding protein [Wenzhouxiangella sp.]TVR92027.1 MAG: ABC transporter substrate-binding protein [Wenzhouxiangellaceae bacterium]
MRTLILGLALLLATPALASNDPVELIRQTTIELFELVEDNRELYQQQPELLREELERILRPNTDMIHSARLVLGRHGRGLEREQVEAFADALSDQLMRRYATGLLEFRSREQVEVLPLAGENTERMTRVRTRIRLDSGSRAPVDYVLRKRDGQWMVFDVIIEGISYVATFRNQIGEEIRRHGFDRMLERLQAGEIEVDVEIDNGNA